ncbi:MAG: hypothetical protein FRX49_13481 [Trebouxia sp. A1-2]|nr:MAG: hypothetical protein FRX49_13481 [Trebouxia sp. A1-2]
MALHADYLTPLSSHLVSAQNSDLNTNVGLLDLVQLIYEVASSPLAPILHSFAAQREQRQQQNEEQQQVAADLQQEGEAFQGEALASDHCSADALRAVLELSQHDGHIVGSRQRHHHHPVSLLCCCTACRPKLDWSGSLDQKKGRSLTLGCNTCCMGAALGGACKIPWRGGGGGPRSFPPGGVRGEGPPLHWGGGGGGPRQEERGRGGFPPGCGGGGGGGAFCPDGWSCIEVFTTIDRECFPVVRWWGCFQGGKVRGGGAVGEPVLGGE